MLYSNLLDAGDKETYLPVHVVNGKLVMPVRQGSPYKGEVL